MFSPALCLVVLSASFHVSGVLSQHVGTLNTETHPSLTIQQCSSDRTCTTLKRSVVLDADWRWVHNVSHYENCISGSSWDPVLCNEPKSCAANCALEGADPYVGSYGISTSGDTIRLKYITYLDFAKNIGSRVFLLEDDSSYQLFHLNNQEFSFDVDASELPCGLNGAVTLVQMDKDGGSARFPTNEAGAKYGTGYCDAKCPHTPRFINGEANLFNWVPSPIYEGTGRGLYGSCCNSISTWDSNAYAASLTAHACTGTGDQARCDGAQCSDEAQGICDKDGCDFNSFRLGNKTFLGPGNSYTLNTKSRFTVVTQFITSDDANDGSLPEIRRFYIQNGKLIPNSYTVIPGLQSYNTVTDQTCQAQKAIFNESDTFNARGGLAALGEGFEKGMVLSMSILGDDETGMLWLDSTYPADADPAKPGVLRGTCPIHPASIPEQPPASVTFSSIKFGPIGSTFNVAPL